MTITLTDSFGNLANGYVGTVHFTSSDGQAVLPPDYTFTAADQGKHTFQVTFKTAGSQSLTVADTVTSKLKATANVSVAVSAQLVGITGLGQTASCRHSTKCHRHAHRQPRQRGNTGYVGTVQFASTDGQAVLPANYTVYQPRIRASTRSGITFEAQQGRSRLPSPTRLTAH